MVSNESRPQGTSIAENWGRPVTAADVRDLMEAEGVPRGKIYKIMQAVQAAISWEHSKALRPWSHEGGLTAQDAARTAERRARLAAQLREEARARDDAQHDMEREKAEQHAAGRAAPDPDPEDGPDAQIIELPVFPGQSIADVIAEFAPEPGLRDPALRGGMSGMLPPVQEPAVTVAGSGRGAVQDVHAAMLPPEPAAPEVATPGPERPAAAPEPSPAPFTPERRFTCRRCERSLPESRFNRDRARPSGRESRCGECKSRDRAYARLHGPAGRAAAQPVAVPAPVPAPAPPAATQPQAAASSPAPPPAVQRTVKACRSCGVPKSLQAFPRNSGAADGRRATCADCAREQRRETASAAGTGTVMKKCRKCGKLRDPEKDFYRRSGRPVSNTCRECEKEMSRTFRERAGR